MFERHPDYVVGLVCVRGAQVGESPPELAAGLDAAAASVGSRMPPDGPDGHPAVEAWSAAFSRGGINPRRYPPSVRTLAERALKDRTVPHINAAVDMGNLVSLQRLTPVGAHDLDRLGGDVEVRLSRAGDTFTPMGSDAPQDAPPGEPVYATGSRIRTRRWTWRQCEEAKVTAETRTLLFPVDGFRGSTETEVREAVDELASLAERFLGPDAEVSTAFVDADTPSVDLNKEAGAARTAGEDRGVPPRPALSHEGERVEPGQPVVRPSGDTALAEWSLDDMLRRGLLESVIVREELERDLASGKRLTIYQGFDPTSPHLHLGHYLSLRVLRWLQLHGHRVIFLIGDFTGRIGDPTDRTGARQPLTHEQVLENAATYRGQIAHVLDLGGENPVEVRMNGEWLDPLALRDVIGLAAKVTVQQLIERDMFQERLNEQRPLYLHEALYPLLQGYDSVAMGVDAELGGRDQMFNMMMGRDLVRSYLGKTKHVLLTPLVPGLDGRKMSKTYGNTVDLTEDAASMFFKLTQVSDGMLPLFLRVFTDAPDEEAVAVESRLAGESNLVDVRERFAAEVTHVFHGAEGTARARAEFRRVVMEGEAPSLVPEVRLDAELFDAGGAVSALDVVAATGLAGSRGDGRRVVLQGGFELDGEAVNDPSAMLPAGRLSGATAKVGRRGFVRIAVPDGLVG